MNPDDIDYRFRVRLHDTDAAGVMFFAHLLRHAHDAYENFLDHAGMELSTRLCDGPHLPIVHCASDYLAPIKLGDEMTVKLALVRLGGKSFSLSYRFEAADGRELARAETVHAAVTHCGAPELPAALRAALECLPPSAGPAP
jgi:1,4-dihydroxy-2-naphthoyl-CoA hydrolase